MAGLRQQKKQAAMRHIQQVAMSLFAREGFTKVTVEQVAAAAAVSPSSIYRYFGSKEGLVLHDEYDDIFLGILLADLRAGQSILSALKRGLAAIGQAHFQDDQAQSLARIELWAAHPAIQAAASLYLSDLAVQLTDAIVVGGRHTRPAAAFITAALLHGMVAAIVTWHADGGQRPVEDYVLQGLAGLAEVLQAD